MPSQPLVHVIDDDDAARDSLAFMLAAVGFTTRTYESAVIFLEALPNLEAGCIITDVRMPAIDGLELLRRVRRQDLNWPVIVTTGQADVPLALEAIRAGASDFIEKPYRDETLLGAVRAALGGDATDPGRISEKAGIRERLALLSSTEEQVLNGLVVGQSNATVASNLGISPHTVEIHRASIMTKMQAKSLSQLVRMMMLAGP